METVFKPWLDAVDLAEVKAWYNGYSWGGEKVYNPFDILLFFDKNKTFRPHWFETGTSTFLIEMLKEKWRYLPEFENYKTRMSDLGTFDLGNIKLPTLLFQSGYLTLVDVDTSIGDPICTLSYPNNEVRSAFNQIVLGNYLLQESPEEVTIIAALRSQDIASIECALRNLFSSIANDNYRNNTIADYEGYYASVVYAYLASLGFTLIAEDVTSTGRIDLTLRIGKQGPKDIVYLFEFKVKEQHCKENLALSQIEKKDYPQKFLNDSTIVHLIGIEFDKDTKTITGFDHQLAQPDAW